MNKRSINSSDDKLLYNLKTELELEFMSNILVECGRIGKINRNKRKYSVSPDFPSKREQCQKIFDECLATSPMEYKYKSILK